MKHTFKLNAHDSKFYSTDKISFEYPCKPSSLPKMEALCPNTQFPERVVEFTQLIIDSRDMEAFKAFVRERGIYLSISNSKVAKGAYASGYERPASFGKSNLATCMYPSEECKLSCYQLPLSKMYAGSRNAHLYNALIFANLTKAECKQAINTSLDKLNPDVVRMLDNGDFCLPGEFAIWDEISRERPEINFYGYTKAGELALQAGLIAGEGVNWNFSDNGDDVSKQFAEVLHDAGHKVCHIEYLPSHDETIPFNQEEIVAMMNVEVMQSRYNGRKFQIGYHGTLHPETNKYFQELEAELNTKVC